MAGDVAIRAEGLSKCFRLGEAAFHRTLRESLTQAVRACLRPGASARRDGPDRDVVWALRDVDLEVGRGEVVGIVGGNGAGKSTLLKILSRITPPTAGRAEIRGRVGSLLEVGTGFHPELTGRENVYMNGAILGMRKAEIDARFDEIVAFSGVDRFLATPVKRYSTGMRVRLAFAVAAHLEPEILIVDEVLAVGDAAFQRRCLAKMGDVARSGRTVLLVSHNLRAVRRLCPRSIWLSEGRIAAAGETDEVVTRYLRSIQKLDSLEKVSQILAELPRDPCFRLLDVSVRQHGVPTTSLGSGEPIEVELVYDVFADTHGLRVYFDLCDSDQERLIRSFHDEDADAVEVVRPGRYRSTATLPANLLAPHDYLLILRGTVHGVRNLTGDGVAIPISVAPTSRINRAYPHEPVRAKLQPLVPWRTVEI
jgi:lipopolysaccharide transport system ATP-binding protein